jgi:formyltetrahydrofolate deformylase
MYRLNLSCADRPGIVASISSLLFSSGCNIIESHQFSDPLTNIFCMRVTFTALDNLSDSREFHTSLNELSKKFEMNLNLASRLAPKNLLLLASKEDHCLLEVLYKIKIGDINANPVAVVSNHDDLGGIAKNNNIPYFKIDHHGKDDLAACKDILRIADELQVDLIGLARYMQILHPQICAEYLNKIINIHHSFLPAFKGAEPYKRANERGVKMIGATAHFANEQLDEGPIISQAVEKVDHSKDINRLKHIGRNIEREVFSRAIKLFCEDRIFVAGDRTIVFE